MLDRAALSRDAVEVAPELLGALLTHRTGEGDVTVRLTEVEAYRGLGQDPGSHAHRGMTPRTTTMFGDAGHLYAYFTYGMHTCVNIVCSPAGSASAVLLRAGEVVDGIDLARSRRPSATRDRDLARGPARLASALGIRLAEDGADLFADPFALLAADAGVGVASGPRVGVSGAGGGAAYPWRFWIPGDPTVSAYRRHARSHD
ncbi:MULTISPECIES: DNA-3-methyladenine glycosylase [unclassified Leifsonia]|uniref:DNA-3-methyladenine glycosylase n=1 Tax=unclassified Leifsonia TaxID=2663824 RepID=UPI0006FB9AD0|nr:MULTISPECIES: DNA-3-methyladenine glycosylase [unclassified Leifsonia]KQX05738.1 DNA-3-methyladenine glycosidase [Leifsonia sp. Root1293]KRA09374.1 DNA-3-methyladenine glycosidase [Leifsonia sp. Root60]